MTISALMCVYNEEARIEATLRSVSWCDEIVVLDKGSTDKTREIASRYTNKIIVFDTTEYSASENEVILNNVTSEWILSATASDVMHPQLAKDIRTLLSDTDFAYDIIKVPFRRFVLGLETPRSPWYSEVGAVAYRKRIVRINKSSVHAAITLDSDRVYQMKKSDRYCVYHLTHATVDSMMERHMRYCRAERQMYPVDKSLWYLGRDFLAAFYNILIKRKTLLMGVDGVALSLAYLSYWMLKFIYIWEGRRGRSAEVYSQIKKSISSAWDEADHEGAVIPPLTVTEDK